MDTKISYKSSKNSALGLQTSSILHFPSYLDALVWKGYPKGAQNIKLVRPSTFALAFSLDLAALSSDSCRTAVNACPAGGYFRSLRSPLLDPTFQNLASLSKPLTSLLQPLITEDTFGASDTHHGILSSGFWASVFRESGLLLLWSLCLWPLWPWEQRHRFSEKSFRPPELDALCTNFATNGNSTRGLVVMI